MTSVFYFQDFIYKQGCLCPSRSMCSCWTKFNTKSIMYCVEPDFVIPLKLLTHLDNKITNLLFSCLVLECTVDGNPHLFLLGIFDFYAHQFN